MQKPEKVALFDFCETLVKFQTADRYVTYVCNNLGGKSIRCRSKIYCWCRKLGLIRTISIILPYASINKRFVLWRLRGINEEVLDNLAGQYYRDEISPNLISATVSELVRLKEAGFRIFLLSGGYDIYLKYFAEEYGIPDVVSSSIAFKKNKCTGLLNGPDCLRGNKVKMLEKYCRENGIEIDRGQSVAFSDSESDLPMFKYVGNRVVVHRRGSRKWYEKEKYIREIIWDV